MEDYLNAFAAICEAELPGFDRFVVLPQVKSEIYQNANIVSETEGISMTEAVERTIKQYGSPQELAGRFIEDIRRERWIVVAKTLTGLAAIGIPMSFIVLRFILG